MTARAVRHATERAEGGGPRLDRPLAASIDVATTPGRVWAVVADLRRTGEWSPECARVLPLGALRRGGWLVGVNHRRAVAWVTLSRIVRYEPEVEIAWRVLTNGAVWSYRLEPTETGTRIVETRDTPRGISRFARGFTRVLLGGQRAHDDELEAGMHAGLRRIRALSTGTAAPGTAATGTAATGTDARRSRRGGRPTGPCTLAPSRGPVRSRTISSAIVGRSDVPPPG